MSGAFARTSSGSPTRWQQAEVVLHPFEPPLQTKVEANAFRNLLVDAARAWNEAPAECALPQLLIAPVEQGKRGSVQDGANTLQLRAGLWCRETADDIEDCYAASRQGITHVFPTIYPGHAEDGLIQEVDVEINGVHFEWSSERGALELKALLVHELGHVLGLDHSCGDIGTCKMKVARQSVMYPQPTEVDRALVLQPDALSLSALCEVYPLPKSKSFTQVGLVVLLVTLSLVAVVLLTRIFVNHSSRPE